MKVENLSEGLIVKNYKELCSLLDLEVKEGNSRKAQLKEVERFIGYEKQGHKFIVNEIYSEPLEMIDGRLLSKKAAEYIDDLELLLLNFLVYNKGDITISKSGIYKALKMVNENYSKYNGDRRPLLAKDMSIDLDIINEYYNDTSSILSNAIKTVLNRLVRKKLIFKTDTKVMAKINVIPEETNSDGSIKVRQIIHTDEETNTQSSKFVPSKMKIEIEHIECSNDEIKKIMAIERKVLLEMGFPEGIEGNKIVATGKWKEFKNKVNPILVEEMNIAYAYDAYKILFNYDDIINARDYLLSKNNRLQKENEINSQVRNHIYSRAKNSSHKAHEKSYEKFGLEFMEESNINQMKPREQTLLKGSYLKCVDELNGKLIHYFTDLESNF